MATKILHLDAALGVTVDGSNLVSQWNDQSGNGYNVVQATPANKPLLVVNQLNGKPVIRFDGSNDYLNKSFGTTYNQPITVFIVMKQAITVAALLDYVFYNYSTPQFDFAMNVGNLPTMHAGTTLNAPAIDTNYKSFTLRYNSVNSTLRQDFVNISKGDTGTNGLNGITLGSDYLLTTGRFFNGDIAELIMYSSITDAEIFALEQQLASKYGLTYPKETFDFITLEEEQLSPALVDSIFFEEEELPSKILEEIQEFSVEEQDLDFTTLEMSLIEKDPLEDTPIFNEIILGESLDAFTIPVPVKIISTGARVILGKLI